MAGKNKRFAFLSNRLGILFLSLIAVFALAFWVWSIWNRPAQMGPDPEVFKTVDALYTAVRNQDLSQVEACEKRLTTLRDDGKLPVKPHQNLSAIILQARGGQWQAAARALYQFMLAQHRSGT